MVQPTARSSTRNARARGRAQAGRDAQVAKVPVAVPVEAPVIWGEVRWRGTVLSTDNVAVNNSR